MDKLPSIITETEWDDNGYARVGSELLVPAYVASQFGFSTPGKEFLDSFYDRLKGIGVLPLCPFKACGEYLDFSKMGGSYDEVIEFWDEFNKLVGPVNYGQLIPASKFMVAILDGGHTSDDGVSAEIAHIATKYYGLRPVIGIRSDFRLAENPAAPINPAVRYFIDQGPYNGQFYSGEDAYDNAINGIAKLSDRLK